MGASDDPVVSVLLPVYNAADTVRAAVESVRRQDFGSWELVCVNDGSSDPSGELLEALAKEDPRIRVVHLRHRGIVGALQVAAAEAKGAYLARMDADDMARSGRLRLQLSCFAAVPGLGMCGGRVSTPGERVGTGRQRYEKWINSLVSHEDIVREIFVECPVPHPTFMMARKWYEAVGGYQQCPWPEDYDLVMRFWMAGAKFSKPEPIILEWSDLPGRLSMTDKRYDEQAFRELKRHYLARVEARKGRPLYQWGAGEVGKRWLREWGDTLPEAVVDINPRKIGRTIHGVRVIEQEQLPAPEDCFVVVTVGTPGARDEIRGMLAPRGFRECSDYLFLA